MLLGCQELPGLHPGESGVLLSPVMSHPELQIEKFLDVMSNWDKQCDEPCKSTALPCANQCISNSWSLPTAVTKFTCRCRVQQDNLGATTWRAAEAFLQQRQEGVVELIGTRHLHEILAQWHTGTVAWRVKTICMLPKLTGMLIWGKRKSKAVVPKLLLRLWEHCVCMGGVGGALGSLQLPSAALPKTWKCCKKKKTLPVSGPKTGSVF